MKRIRLIAALTIAATLIPIASMPANASASNIPGFQSCAPGPNCDIEAAHFHFKNYSSVCSLQDCGFVSAANWEELVLALSPSVGAIKSEYQADGQTFGGGLSMGQMFNYWKSQGIDGVRITSNQSYYTNRTDVEHGVLDYSALIVRDATIKGSYVGTDQWTANGTAIMVVDGFTPKGPLVVYEATEIQMTWSQWNHQVKDMWGMVASAGSGTSPTTTTTVPTNSTTTTIVPNGSDYGPRGEKYQTYGNVYPADLGDCTFAAAANWEQILLGDHPDPSVIGYEFAEAGGNATTGLTMDQLFSYWETQGIAGVTISGVTSYDTDPQDVENAVNDYTALVVSLQFISGDYFGSQEMDAGGHAVVVDGYTPEGPLVVSWGKTIQMSWDQWNAEVVDMWGINQ
jgi:hypothetical protein